MSTTVYKLDRPVYLNADKTKAVEAGSQDARWLLGGPGALISRSDAERYGLLDSAEETTRVQEELAARYRQGASMTDDLLRKLHGGSNVHRMDMSQVHAELQQRYRQEQSAAVDEANAQKQREAETNQRYAEHSAEDQQERVSEPTAPFVAGEQERADADVKAVEKSDVKDKAVHKKQTKDQTKD